MTLCHVVNSSDKYVHLNTYPVALCGVSLPADSRFASSTTWIKETDYHPRLSVYGHDYEPVDCPNCWAHLCKNCGHWLFTHVGNKCLFMESYFAPTGP